jgi:Flp pilus assembly protein TadD
VSSSPSTRGSSASQATPDRYGQLLARAGRALRAKRPDDARRLLEEALAGAPDEPRAKNLLGLAYFKLGRLRESGDVYEELTRRFPKEPSLFVNLGLVRLREGDLEAAERALGAALARAPDHRRAHCYLGLVLYRRGDLAEARRHFLAGDAHELARRVDRISTPAAPTEGGLLRDVSAAAEAALASDVQPFRPIDVEAGASPARDDGDWRAEVEHHQSVPVPDPAEPSSLRAPEPKSGGRAASRSMPGFQLASATVELRALAVAAEDVAPEPPEVVFSVETGGRSLLTREEVDALESGLGRPGFVAGPGGRAKLTLTGSGAIRRDALVLALGRRDFRGGPGVPGAAGAASWWSLDGPSVLLLSVEGVAVALRELKDAVFAPGVLRGYAGDWRVEPGPRGGVELLGEGSALITAPGIPLIVPLAPEREVLCAEAALLGWSNRVSVVPSRPDAPDGRVEARGPGWILVSERAGPGAMR